MNQKQLAVTVLVGILGINSLMAVEIQQKAKQSNQPQNRRALKKWSGKKRSNLATRKRHIMYYLNANYAAELKAIHEQMKSNPKSAKAKLQTLIEKGEARMKAERREYFALIKQYWKTQDEAVLNKIRAKIATNYDKRIAYSEKVVARFDKRLDKAKARLTELKNNREKNIDKAIARIKAGKRKSRKPSKRIAN